MKGDRSVVVSGRPSTPAPAATESSPLAQLSSPPRARPSFRISPPQSLRTPGRENTVRQLFQSLATRQFEQLPTFYSRHVAFSDPARRLVGVGEVARHLATRFDRLGGARFELEQVLGVGATYAALWHLIVPIPGSAGETVRLKGFSQIEFEPESARIVRHEDHLDRQAFATAPHAVLSRWMNLRAARRAS